MGNIVMVQSISYMIILTLELRFFLVFHALGPIDVKRVHSKFFFESQLYLIHLKARLIP